MESRLALPSGTILDSSYRIAGVVGSGGFGITYEAEDVNLGTLVAIKEYYPVEFGDRDATMSVRPKSTRHKQTFEWGRTSFLQEARMLARFRHPSIVRVSRVFEANATAYMVMDFEAGQSFDAWLTGLGRPPTQEELDRIVAPLLDALELMHAESFLHRDIAPDNIVVRLDGSPVLLDFGAARRAVAEMSRSLTGIVKAGYSPHEQYATDSRLQGPWSDLYALGATLYRAVVGRPPEEATLRLADDRMRPATEASRGEYRRSFLAAVDACLAARHTDRPQSVAQLRPMLLSGVAIPSTQRLPDLLPHAPPPIPTPNGDKGLNLKNAAWFPITVLAGAGVSAAIFGGIPWIVRPQGEMQEILVQAQPWLFSFVFLPIALVVAGERRLLPLFVVSASWIVVSIAAYPIYKLFNPVHGTSNLMAAGGVGALVNMTVVGAAALFMPALRKPLPIAAAAAVGLVGGMVFERLYTIEPGIWSWASTVALTSSVVPLFVLLGFGLAHRQNASPEKSVTGRMPKTRRLPGGETSVWAGGLLALLALISWFLLGPLVAIGYGLCAVATAAVGQFSIVAASTRPRAAITTAAVAVTVVAGLLYGAILINWLHLPMVSRNVIDALMALWLGGTSGWLYAMWRVCQAP